MAGPARDLTESKGNPKLYQTRDIRASQPSCVALLMVTSTSIVREAPLRANRSANVEEVLDNIYGSGSLRGCPNPASQLAECGKRYGECRPKSAGVTRKMGVNVSGFYIASLG